MTSSNYDILSENLLTKYEKYMLLKIYLDTNDTELIDKYSESIKNHNMKLHDINHIDAGFDLFCPNTKIFVSTDVNKLDYNIVCSAQIIKRDQSHSTGFYMYPRSSISKTKLRLANNVGIIDAGYRGHLIGMFDLINTDKVTSNKFDRYLQICAPGLIPIMVQQVICIEDLGEKTLRGDGGFGSTGI
jgi:dUTP pyrophosphatase